MNILVAHNRYALSGGEEEAYLTEVELLRRHGHTVVTYEQDNRAIADLSRSSVARRAFWSREDYRAVRALLREHRIDVLSTHNFFPLLSPSIFYAAAAERVATVQTLHNYRLLCPGGMFLRDGRVCEDCLGKSLPWPGAVHGCYRDSRLQSAITAGMLFSHRIAGTWDRKVTRYVALTEFMRAKMIAGGLPADRIVVKPNSVEDAGIGSGEGDDFLYVGRLSAEKGVEVLLRAWGHLRALEVPKRRLRIVGSGPEEMNLRARAANWPEVTFHGRLPRHQILEEMGRAAAVILPSIWYEGLSLVLAEAFSVGTPVVASNIGSMVEAVHPGVNGVLFNVGDADALAAALQHFPSRGENLDCLRSGARAHYERLYACDIIYEKLMEIYSQVMLEVRGAGVTHG